MRKYLLVLLSLALGCWRLFGVGISESDAATAARAWAASGDALGLALSSDVEETSKVVSPDGYSFFVVKMKGGGSVVLSSDTESEPIVAFSANSDLDLTSSSFLYEFLCKDARARSGLRNLAATASSATAATLTPALTAAAKGVSLSKKKWSALLGNDSASTGAPSSSTSTAKPVSSVSDVRRSPLVQSKWSQGNGGGGYCWNYHTPSHYVCGCTATASSQIMRYFCYPTASQPQRTVTCTVDGKSKSLTTIGGVFDWNKMTLVLGSSESDANRSAIGQLTSDVGIVLKSSYASGGTSAEPEAPAAMYRTFGYKNAFAFWDGKSYYTGSGGLHNLSLREKIIYANLDAGKPVQLAIYGYAAGHIGDSKYWSGHSVIGDGYGYKDINGDATAFVHINMGWEGLDDMWYNIPEINASQSGAHQGDSGYDFLYMGGGIFNISTDKAGLEILSGRVVDEDGKPVKDAIVTAFDASRNAVGNAITDDHGIYAFELSGGASYNVSAKSADELFMGDLEDTVYLKKTTGNSSYVVSDSLNVGNSWGNDVVLSSPAAEVNGEHYTTLDKALEAANDMQTAEVVPVKLLLPIEFKNTVAVECKCLIYAENPEATTVGRGAGVKFTVESGAVLTLSNVTFRASQETLVDVLAGGRLTVCDGVTMGVDCKIAAVTTATKDGFALAGVPSATFALNCDESPDLGEFGTATCDIEKAKVGVAKIVNPNDAYGEIGGVVDENLVLSWGARIIDPEAEDAVGYYVDVDGVTNCYARLDRLLERFIASMDNGKLSPDTALRLKKGGDWERMITVSSGLSLTVIGNGDVSVTNIASEAGFTVNGGSLTLNGVSYSGYVGNGFITLNSGELTLGDGTEIFNMTSTSSHSAAVVANGGILTMLEGALIRDCGYSTTTSGKGYGGGVYLAEGSEFKMLGGTITGCKARTYGGGVYVDYGAKMGVSGSATVTGNTRKSGTVITDDICKFGKVGELQILGMLTGRVGFRWSDTSGRNSVGKEFITVGSGVGAVAVRGSLTSLQNNMKSELVASYADGKVTWEAASTEPKEVPVSEAVAEVVTDDGTRYFGTLNDAFIALKGDGAVNVLKDAWFTSSLVITNKVSLQSKGGSFTVSRMENCNVQVNGSGAELTIGALTLKGSAVIDGTKVSGATNMVYVQGGKLTLNAGAVISDVQGKQRDLAGVVVWQGGQFTMNAGAMICNCTSEYSKVDGCGSALIVDGESTAYLNGGTITGCTAVKGAVCVANGSDVYVNGGLTIDDNFNLNGEQCNMVVHDKSDLYLNGALTDSVGLTTGIFASTNVFGEVTAELGYAALTNSAANFANDTTDAYGIAVTNSISDKTYLVWSSSIASDGSVTVTIDGVPQTFWCVGDIPRRIVVVPVQPFNATGIALQTGSTWLLTFAPGTAWCKYTLFTCDDLNTHDWQPVGEQIILKPEDIGEDGSFIFTPASTGDKRFWKVIGEDGETIK